MKFNRIIDQIFYGGDPQKKASRKYKRYQSSGRVRYSKLYGYESDESGTYTPIPHEAEIIKYAFSLFADNLVTVKSTPPVEGILDPAYSDA